MLNFLKDIILLFIYLINDMYFYLILKSLLKILY